jgi:hypothetical protein
MQVLRLSVAVTARWLKGLLCRQVGHQARCNRHAGDCVQRSMPHTMSWQQPPAGDHELLQLWASDTVWSWIAGHISASDVCSGSSHPPAALAAE